MIKTISHCRNTLKIHRFSYKTVNFVSSRVEHSTRNVLRVPWWRGGLLLHGITSELWMSCVSSSWGLTHLVAFAAFLTQYLFGDSLLVAPITEAVDNVTGMVSKKIWIPEVWCVWWCGVTAHTVLINWDGIYACIHRYSCRRRVISKWIIHPASLIYRPSLKYL